MTEYVVTYAYDAPRYKDMIVEAEDEDQALALAQAALDAGRFYGVICDQVADEINDERIFTRGSIATPADLEDLARMQDLIDPIGGTP